MSIIKRGDYKDLEAHPSSIYFKLFGIVFQKPFLKWIIQWTLLTVWTQRLGQTLASLNRFWSSVICKCVLVFFFFLGGGRCYIFALLSDVLMIFVFRRHTKWSLVIQFVSPVFFILGFILNPSPPIQSKHVLDLVLKIPIPDDVLAEPSSVMFALFTWNSLLNVMIVGQTRRFTLSRGGARDD